MNTITTYEEDGSAMSRIHAWTVSWRLALDSPFVGGGFRAFQDEIWSKYLPEQAPMGANAHSIYFHVLGEHGFSGLLLYLSLIVANLASLRRIRRDAKHVQSADWMINYSYMVETGLAGFIVSGAFQNLSYFDLFYFLIGVTIILKQLIKYTMFRERQLQMTPPIMIGKAVTSPT
jgi:probable O-glycosylation ligase (exosortase A-associated)